MTQVLMPPETEEQIEESTAQPPLRMGEGELHLTIRQEDSLWASLVANVRDAFSKEKLPPLELTSKPLEGADYQEAGKTKWSRGAIITSVVVNGVLLVLLITLAVHKIITAKAAPVATVTDVSDVSEYKPTFKGTPGGGGGGGGDNSPTPAPKGKLPDVSAKQEFKPIIPVVEAPKLAINPTVEADMKLPSNPLPTVGALTGPTVSVASNGTGSGGGIGSGTGGGVGSGNGNGVGNGSGRNFGGGVYKPGGGVSDPELVYSVDPEFSDEARKNRYQGAVLVSLIVGPEGLPHNVKVLRPLGMGLDEKAIEAVKQYKFKPSTKDGKPVAVQIAIEVTFHIY